MRFVIQRVCEASVAVDRFGAEMKVSLVNDGPFTILLDSDEIVR